MLLGTLSANLSGNILTDKGINTAGEGVIRAGYGNKKGGNKQTRSWKQNGFLMLPHPLNNEHGFKGIYSRDNLLKRGSTECNSVERKDQAYIINLDEYSNIGAHWIPLYAENNDVTYFDRFGVEYIPKDIKTFIINMKTITRKNICYLIDWEEYNIGRICTLFSIFELFD